MELSCPVTKENVADNHQKNKSNDQTSKFDKQRYRTLFFDPENVLDIYQKYLSNIVCPAWIFVPGEGGAFLCSVRFGSMYVSHAKCPSDRSVAFG